MSLTPTDVEYLKQVVSKTTGNTISSRQDYLFESRLAPIAVEAGLKTIEDLIHKLQQSTFDNSLKEQVAEALTINETSFFRDATPYKILGDKILPEFVEKRAASKRISIWSSACSSGQEPYSIGMSILDRYPQLSNWQIKIIATDVCDEMLKKTRSATYSQFEVNRGLPAALLVKYFLRKGNKWQLNDNVRKMVECQRLNLVGVWPRLPKFDIVFMRNVLIYFDQPLKEKILNNVHKQMAKDGILILGGGETLIKLPVPFKPIDHSGFTCYQPQ